jgi:hypothetical protein
MFALLQVSTVATLGYLCVAAGFLLILACVVFIIKGKAVLGESGAANTVEWEKIKVNLTSAVALFVLGAVMVALPFWRFQESDAKQQESRSRQAPTALLTGKITGPNGRDIRLLLVEKPDYDQTYSGDIVWQVPLLADKASYSVFYVDGNTILGQQPFSVEGATAGSGPQKISLPPYSVQTEAPAVATVGSGVTLAAQQISPKLEVSDAELKSLGIH